MKSAALTSIAILLTALPLCSQAPPSRVSVGADSPTRLEVALAYSTVRSDTIPGGCACFWMQGGKAEFRAAFSSRIGFAGELAGHHAGNINSAQEGIGLLSYLFGPRFSWEIHRYTPFVQVLAGGVHGFDAVFPNSNRSTTVPDAFAMTAGGGMNIGLLRRPAIRPFQADYFLTSVPNTAANRQNSLRLGGGLVFKLSPPH